MAEARVVEFDLDPAGGSARSAHCDDRAFHAEGLGGIAVEDLDIEALGAGWCAVVGA
ncbi:hypothetical protein ACH4NT_28850 [Streptomyces lydicus]|uniref:hypothetical protein n=1 Tax=Streptomyces lydicus TaxID=47763 RepID=UPI003792661A